MISVKHVGEAMIGAVEHGEHAGRYPVATDNKTFKWMIQEFEKGLGIHKPIMQPGPGICAKGAESVVKEEAKHGNEPGLDLPRLMKDIMSEEIYIPEEEIRKSSELLGYGMDGLEEAIAETMHRCYPNGFGKGK